jgi:predicted ATP-grasp superfamily ATP-dependent carboligase
MQYLDLTGQAPAPRRETAQGVKWLESIADFYAFKQYHERGELTFKEWFKSMWGAKVFALFAWDDPLPFLLARKFGLSYSRILQYLIRDFLRRRFTQRAGASLPSFKSTTRN